MGHAQHEIGDDHQQGNEKERDRGAGSKIAALNAEGESQRGKRLRGVKRAAGGEDVDDGHVSESEDEAEEHGDAEDGLHHRNDDLELRAPETGAIDSGGFRDVLGDGGAPGEKNDGGKGHETPAMHKQNGEDGEMRLAQPHGGIERLEEVEGHQHPSDDAIDGVQDPFPSDGAERNRRNPREKNEKTNDAAATEGFFQGDGKDVGTDDDDDLREDGEDERIANSNAKAGALQNTAEIFEADVMHLDIADAGVTESIKNGQEKRTADQEQDVEDRGGQHRRAEQRALGRAQGFEFGVGYCHVRGLGSTR